MNSDHSLKTTETLDISLNNRQPSGTSCSIY